MARRRISEAQRRQIIDMHTTGMSFKAIGRQMGYHYTVVSRLVRKNTQTNNVRDLPRSDRPRVASDRDDRALQRLVVDECHSQPFPYSDNTGCPIDVCQQEKLETVWNHCPAFRKPPTSYGCMYGWQRQASSFKSSNRLPPKWSRDFFSLASHEPGFESNRAYLGHVMPSYTGSGTTCAKHLSVGSSIASEINYHNRTSEVLLEGWDAGLRPSSKLVGFTPGTELWTIDFVKWFISDVLKVKWQSYHAFWTVKVNT